MTPGSAPLDVPFTIRATGLHPNESVTVIAAGRSSNVVRWHASRKAVADSHGRLLLRDRYVLSWLRPTPDTASEPFPETITITVRAPGIDATAHARRAPPPSSSFVRRELRLATTGFYGEWITPRAARRHTAIVLFGGSDGGIPAYVDTIGDALVGDGYPVLELAYFLEPGLPQQLREIPLEYFGRALRWLRARRASDPRRIVTIGVSRGGELSLILASVYPELVHAAAGYVPSAFVEPAFTARPAPAWTYHGRAYEGENRAIPIEKSAGPIFVVGGGADHIWPSARFVKDIATRMHAHGRADVTALIYPAAGHLVGTAVPVQEGSAVRSEPTGNWGGTPEADERGRQDSWPKLLRFLSRL